MSLFFKAARPPLKPIQPPSQWIRRLFLRGYSGQNVKLTDLPIVPQWRMSGATAYRHPPPPIPEQHAQGQLCLYRTFLRFSWQARVKIKVTFFYNPPSWDDLISIPRNNLCYLWCADIATGPPASPTATTHYLYYASNKSHKQA